MEYIKILIITNVFILFIISIYNIFFYNKRDNISKELMLILINITIIFLNNYFNINSFIYFLTITSFIIHLFHKDKMSLFFSLWNSVYILFVTNNYCFIIIYILYNIVYKIKNKLLWASVFSIITIFYILLFNGINKENIYLSIIYILSILIIYLYIKLINNRFIKLFIIKEIEKENAFKTSIFKVTHEIKNPLSVIKGYISIFDYNDQDKIKKYISILDTEVDNALLVLKDFSEINNMKINKEYINFNKLLIETKNTIKPFTNNKRINIIIDSEKDIYLYADYNRLKQVLVNVLKNSIEAFNYDGNINIKAYISNNKLLINIKDNGPGMDKETLDNLWTPFYTKKSFGTGLGLCLSKEIIDKHNGTIKYSSELNKYTLVKIVLPINNNMDN